MALRDSLVAVKYVGKKETKYDTVCFTPTTWAPGSTRPVEPAIAAKLLAYPNIWIEGEMDDVDLPKSTQTQQPVAPMTAAPPVKKVPPKEVPTVQESPPAEPEEFKVELLLTKPFVVFCRQLSALTEEQIDQANTAERAVKKRPGYLKAIQDELERRAQAAA